MKICIAYISMTVGLLIGAAILASGCENELKQKHGSTLDVGSAALQLTIPSDTFCIEITVEGEARKEVRTIGVVPGTDVTIPLDGLPIGEDIFTGVAYNTFCGDVNDTTVAVWITATSVSATVTTSPPATVMLTFVRNGQVIIDGVFEEDLENAVPVVTASTETPSGVQLGQMVVDPSTGYLYAASADTNTVYILNSDLEEVDTITTTGTAIASLDIDPNPESKRLFVGIASPASVEIFDLTPTITQSCVTDANGFGVFPLIAFNPSNNRIYAAMNSGARVVDSDCNIGPLVDVGYGTLAAAAVDTVANRVYMPLHHDWKLVVIDGTDADLDPSDAFVLEDLTIHGDPLSIDVDSYNHRVFVGMNIGSAIERVDLDPQTGLPPFTHEGLPIGNAPAILKANPTLDRVYVAIRDFLQIGTVTGGEVTQFVTSDQLGMIPRFMAVDTHSHCLYVTNHPANPENRIVKLCEPAKKQLGIAALKRTIKRCVTQPPYQDVLLADVDEVVESSCDPSKIDVFNNDVEDLAGDCVDELTGLSEPVWKVL